MGKKIAVVGSGPAGLSAAIGFAKRRHQVHVFETLDENLGAHKNRDFSYPVDITGHGMKCLRYLSIADDMFEYSYNFHGIKRQYSGTKNAKVINAFEKEEGGPGLIFSKNGLALGLIDLIEKRLSSTVHLHFDTAVLDVENVEENEDKCMLTVNRLNSGISTVGPFDLVIVADGSRSLLRSNFEKRGLIKTHEFDTDAPMFIKVLNLDKDVKLLDPEYLTVFNGRYTNNLSFACAAVLKKQGKAETNQSAQCSLMFSGSKKGKRKDSKGNTNDVGNFVSNEELKTFLRKLSPDLEQMVTEKELTDFRCRRAHDCGKGRFVSKMALPRERIVLLGDAAGSFPPCGHGVNCALESAMLLDQMCDVYDDDFPYALAKFDAARLPEVHALTEFAADGTVLPSTRGPLGFFGSIDYYVNRALFRSNNYAVRTRLDDQNFAYSAMLRKVGKSVRRLPWDSRSCCPQSCGAMLGCGKKKEVDDILRRERASEITEYTQPVDDEVNLYGPDGLLWEKLENFENIIFKAPPGIGGAAVAQVNIVDSRTGVVNISNNSANNQEEVEFQAPEIIDNFTKSELMEIAEGFRDAQDDRVDSKGTPRDDGSKEHAKDLKDLLSLDLEQIDIQKFQSCLDEETLQKIPNDSSSKVNQNAQNTDRSIDVIAVPLEFTKPGDNEGTVSPGGDNTVTTSGGDATLSSASS